MALKITLKPNEKIIISGAVVTNGPAKSVLLIENKTAILRQKDILTEDHATSPARKIYFIVQMMYIDEDNLTTHHNTYWKLVRDFINASPSSIPLIDEINEHIVHSRYYPALKLAKNLIEYEYQLITQHTSTD
jgi:flagellar protein FlbT